MTKKKIDVLVSLPMIKIIQPETADRLEIDQDEINRLAGSIKELGQLTPIEVVPSGDRYEIVFGHRRYLAHKVLGKKTINGFIKDLDHKEVKKRRATENLGRINLSAVEEGAVYLDLKNEFHMTKNQIAAYTGKPSSRVQRCIEIHRMPLNIQQAVHRKKISLGVAESLMRCGDEGHREYLLEMCIEHGVTVAVTRQWVEDWKKEQRSRKTDIERGGDEHHLMETPPVYMACNICKGPTDIRDVKYLQICPSCNDTLVNALKDDSKRKGS